MITITLDIGALDRLRQAWERGDDDRAVVAAVRDVFDGQDGHLRKIDAIDSRQAVG